MTFDPINNEGFQVTSMHQLWLKSSKASIYTTTDNSGQSDPFVSFRYLRQLSDTTIKKATSSFYWRPNLLDSDVCEILVPCTGLCEIALSKMC